MKKKALSQIENLPDVTLTEFKGVLFLHLGTDWIQGAMRLGKPNEIVLDYVQQMMIWMLFNDKPSHIVQLGLGSAALTKFSYHHFADAKVTAIELNPEVINVCRSTFHLPEDDDRLSVLQADAMEYIDSKKHKNEIDVLQVDLYDEKAAAPVFDSREFYQSCADALKPDGMMTVNIFGAASNSSRSIAKMEGCFDGVIWLPEVDGGNVVVLAFKRSPVVDFEELYRRAKIIQRQTRLKSGLWIEYLKGWMRGE